MTVSCLYKGSELFKTIANNFEWIGDDLALSFSSTSELFVSISNRLMADHNLLCISRIKVFPRNVPDVISTASENSSTLLEIVNQSINWVAVELKSVCEDCDRLHFAVVTSQHEVWLACNANALGAS
jgi:hypothetical protein